MGIVGHRITTKNIFFIILKNSFIDLLIYFLYKWHYILFTFHIYTKRTACRVARSIPCHISNICCVPKIMPRWFSSYKPCTWIKIKTNSHSFVYLYIPMKINYLSPIIQAFFHPWGWWLNRLKYSLLKDKQKRGRYLKFFLSLFFFFKSTRMLSHPMSGNRYLYI